MPLRTTESPPTAGKRDLSVSRIWPKFRAIFRVYNGKVSLTLHKSVSISTRIQPVISSACGVIRTRSSGRTIFENIFRRGLRIDWLYRCVRFVWTVQGVPGGRINRIFDIHFSINPVRILHFFNIIRRWNSQFSRKCLLFLRVLVCVERPAYYIWFGSQTRISVVKIYKGGGQRDSPYYPAHS